MDEHIIPNSLIDNVCHMAEESPTHSCGATARPFWNQESGRPSYGHLLGILIDLNSTSGSGCWQRMRLEIAWMPSYPLRTVDL